MEETHPIPGCRGAREAEHPNTFCFRASGA